MAAAAAGKGIRKMLDSLICTRQVLILSGEETGLAVCFLLRETNGQVVCAMLHQ